MSEPSSSDESRPRGDRPRILLCTPEITELPEGMGNAANLIRAKGGGLGDISAGLIRHLHHDDRFDLQVALPRYDRQIEAQARRDHVDGRALFRLGPVLKAEGVHLVQDSAFSASPEVYSESDAHPRLARALAFQRAIINQLLDSVRPDVVHCNDWMTGLVVAAAKARGIRTVFTIHNIFTELASPDTIDRAGIDLRPYLSDLYFEQFPGGSTDDVWYRNRVDFTASAIHAADVVNTVSQTFLDELVSGAVDDVAPASIVTALRGAHAAGRAIGILNAPNDSVDPRKPRFAQPFGFDDVLEGKAANKAELQRRLGLAVDPDAPLFLWLNRLYSQKGTGLLIKLLQRPIARRMQVAVVANGGDEAERVLGVLSLGSEGRVARASFSEELCEIGKAGADFVMMPSRYEPCGLPQMEGPRFGALPVVRRVGGLADTVHPLSDDGARGNGFVFDPYDVDGFQGAVEGALAFRGRSEALRRRTLRRVMKAAFAEHSLAVTASEYVDVYERLLAQGPGS